MTCKLKRGKFVVSVQLPGANHFDLLNPGGAGWGAERQRLQLWSGREQGECGEFWAFQCETSSRKEGGRAPGALNQNDRQPPGLQDTNCPGHLAETDKEPPHHLPEEDKADTGVQNILCSVKDVVD